MKSRRVFIAYLATLFILGATLASAQQAQLSTETLSLHTGNPPVVDWAQTVHVFDNWHGKLFVVTLNHPDHRYNCKVQSIDEAGIICAASGLHSARTFARDNIAALISPGYHESFWLYLLIGAVIGAGILTGGTFLAATSTAWAIVLYVFGSVLLWCWPVGLMGAGNNDTPDEVLYQRPNTPLTVHLQ